MSAEDYILKKIEDEGTINTLFINEDSFLSFPKILKGQPLKEVILEEVVCPESVLEKLLAIDTIEQLTLNFIYYSEEDQAEDIPISYLPRSMEKLTNLRFLELSGNHLSSIPECIQRFSMLEHLDLSENKLNRDSFSIKLPHSLTYLDIGYNAMYQIPDTVWQLPNLKTLILDHCKLESIQIPVTASGLISLWINYNPLKSAPGGLKHLTNLQRLKMIGCDLSKIPTEISYLQKLEKIDINGNKLTQLDDAICQLTSLTHLHAHRNSIQVISKEIGNLKSLQWLDLYDNKIQHLPDGLKHLNELRHLGLSTNKFQEFPKPLYDMPHLEHVSLNWNFLSQVFKRINGMKSLKSLELHSCKILFLADEITELDYLEKLTMGCNWIKKLPPLGKLKKLKFLDISGNQEIENIEEELLKLQGLDEVTELSLTLLPIKKLPEELKSLKKLKRINLGQITFDPDVKEAMIKNFHPILLWMNS